MYHAPVARKARSFSTIVFLIIGLFLLAAAPAFAQIRSVQGRVIQQPEDVVLTRKAKFLPGDILGQPMVALTVRNEVNPATLLLEMIVDFGGAWDSDYLKVRFVINMTAGQSLNFTNASILSDTELLQKVRTAVDMGFEYSESLMTNTNITSMDQIINIGSIQMPEGTYTISLNAYEIELSDTSDINSSITKITQKGTTISVDFNVVSIGEIGSVVVPSLGNEALVFKVPEIPVYNDARGTSTSSTKIKINGPGVTNYSAQKAHARSVAGSSSIKGYPSDLSGGEVTYDLSSVLFRAGQTYSIEMSFDDWNTPPANIATKTTSVTFPTPRITQSATVSDDYKATFSWGFTGNDYSRWVKEYRVYLNGNYKGYTTDTTFELAERLNPGTTYQWHVMPINRDGEPFFSQPEVKTLTTPAHTELAVRIDSPASNSVLLSGSSYNFEGSADYSNGAAFTSATWRFGTETKTGLSASYTPTRRYANNSLAATLSVTDSLGLTRTSPAVNLTVLDPAVAISGGLARTANVGTAVSFSIDAANSRDIASYEWFADGSSIGSGTSKSHSFAESGAHTVYVVGTSAPDINGITKTARSANLTVTVAGAGPAISITQPASGGELILGNSVRVIAAVTNENPLKSVSWSIAGPDTSQTGASGSTLTFSPRSAGEYTLTATALDTFDKSAQASTRVLVNDATVAITSPAANAVLALSGTLTPTISAPNADRITWSIDGTEVGSSSAQLSAIGAGTHSMRATAFWNTMNIDGQAAEYSENSASVSFIVRDMVPPSVTIRFPRQGMTLKTGEQYSLEADVASQSAVSQSYWEVSGARLSGAVYAPPISSTQKSLTITHKAQNADRIEGSASVQVNLINPSVILPAPSSTEYAVGAVLPLNPTAVDASLYWIVDGTELGSWNRAFTEPGAHTVRAGWRATAVDGSGTEREFSGESSLLTFSIYSTQPPVISAFLPAASPVREIAGADISFSVSAQASNPIATTAWTVLSGSSTIGSGTGTSFTYRFASAGQYTVRAQVSDTRALTALREWTVKVIDPQISITYPTAGAVFATGAVPAPTVSTRDLASYSLILDGNLVPAGFNWNSLAAGNHTLTAQGAFSTTNQAAPQTVNAAPVQFRVENRTPPQFTIEGVRDGDRIIAGKTYNFIVSRNGEETVQWLRNGAIVTGSGPNGMQYSFTPVAGEGEIPFAVRGTLNGTTTEKSFKVRVVDPYVSIVMPVALAFQGQYPSGVPLPLQTERRDIDRIEWLVDLQPFTGTAVTFQPGSHSISVRAFASGVRLPSGNYGEYEYSGSGITGRDFMVAGRPSISALTVPQALYVGETVVATLAATGDQDGQLISSITYSVDGRVYRQERAPVSKSVTIPGLSAGRHTISAAMVDVFGTTSSRETATTIYAPLALSIIRPAAGARLSPDANLMVEMAASAAGLTGIAWSVDGSVQPTSNFISGSLGRLSPGTHVVSVSALDALGRSVSSSVNVEVQSDFQLRLAAPAPGTQVVVGNEIAARVEFERVSGSQVDLSDAAGYVTWYVNGASTGSTGLTYSFNNRPEGEYTIQARYSKEAMQRSTDERRVAVRDIAAPAIVRPVNGSRIVYGQGSAVQLSGTGEPGATFVWSLDGVTVAVGAEASFVPLGISGQRQLKLTTSSAGRVKERLVTVDLVPNTPPALTLSAPAIQYVGDMLSWTISAYDVEDGSTVPATTMFLDGVPLPGGVSRLLVPADTGVHALSARVVDSSGAVATSQAGITVERSDLGLQIQSPLAGATHYEGYEVRLAALLANQPLSGAGSYEWTVQYLDDPAAPTQTFSGNTASLRPAALGEVAISARYIDAAGRERGSGRLSIHVEREPLTLGIAWPHGTVVNEGDSLSPSVIGLPAGADQGAVTWTLNGITIADLSNLSAPAVPGRYTLIAQYARNGAVDRAQVEFTVNANPKVAITSPQSGGQFRVGSPLVLSAQVTDDQAFSGNLAWTLQDGTAIGEGNPFVARNLGSGTQTIIATARDGYGAIGNASIDITLYSPIAVTSTSAHGGLPTYLLADGSSPLIARIEYSGGIAPQADWSLRQGDRIASKQGADVAFMYTDLSTFGEDPATLSVVVRDMGIADESAREAFRKDFTIQLSRDASATLEAPVAGQILRAGEAVSLNVILAGFTAPSFAMQLNGVDTGVAWNALEGATRYSATLPGAAVPSEGIYNLLIEVAENGTLRSIPFTLNIYAPRIGVFVDGAPAEIDLEGNPGRVDATVEGLPGVDTLAWKTDLSENPIAMGGTLDLAAAGLAPGNRTITVEARSGSAVAASRSFSLRVLGPMSIAIIPATSPLIVQRGAEVTLEAQARDRDGSSLSGEAISWTSHLDGLLARGSTLDLATLADLTGGEHVITVEATGAFGKMAATVIALRVNVPESAVAEEPEEEGPGDTEQPGAPGNSFDPGQMVDPSFMMPGGSPFGPGGGPPDPGLFDLMGGFMGGFGGPGFGGPGGPGGLF